MSTKDYFEIAFGFANVGILCVTAYFIYRSIYSPIDAVKVGRQLNKEQKKDDAKRSLFLLLFSLRGHPVHYDFVRGLNQIEVVFEDVPQVIQAWRTHFASLQIKNQANSEKNWEIERAALLSAMAVHLGYSNIPHSELLRDYYPEGHDNQLKDDLDFRQAASVFLKSGAALHELIIRNYEPTKPDDKIDDVKPH
ncbi:DUF6680 family protein [Terrimonas pollutisoli]|uniref:DUF6680 family protein n=1 Tax=Terrimonas pollutisoli TaxID=3034147 RepID=UPI0023EB2574|nr:DUF6680 family protein [Terrimonas sp. H1YJ31]